MDLVFAFSGLDQMGESKMRLGVVTHNFPRIHSSGQEAAGNFVVTLCEEIIKQGHFAAVFTQDVLGEKQKYDFPVTWFPWKKREKLLGKLSPFNLTDMLGLYSLLKNGPVELDKFVREHQIEKLLVLWAFPSGYYCLKCPKKVPYDVWCLGADIWTYSKKPVIKNWIQKTLEGAQKVYADGLALCDEVSSRHDVSCRFLPSTRFSAPDIKPVAKKSGDVINFLFVGRFEPAKGPDLFVKAVIETARENTRVQARIFGGGSLLANITSLLSKISGSALAERIKLGGYLSREEFMEQLTWATYLVIPSRKDSIPLILTDAIAAGVPVLTSDTGDLSTLTQKYQIGRSYEGTSHRSLANAMKEAVRNPFFLNETNRKNYLNDFNIETTVKKLALNG